MSMDLGLNTLGLNSGLIQGYRVTELTGLDSFSVFLQNWDHDKNYLIEILSGLISQVYM